MKTINCLKAGITGVLLALIAAACSPRAGDTPTLTSQAQPAQPAEQPTVAPLATTPPGAAATSEPASERAGFVVYDETQRKFIAYGLDDASLNFEISAQDVDLHPDLVQVVGGAVYYRTTNKSIVHADAHDAHTLDAIPVEHLSAFKVSPDEKQIAWSVDVWDQTPPYSELWIANVDGTDARAIAKSTTDASFELLLPKPYAWTADGKLLVAEIPTGIGGYILYRAWNSLQVYDPAAGQTAALYKPAQAYEVCLSGVAPDLSRVVFGCSEAGAGKVSLLTVADGVRVPVPDLPEQGQAGSARFSPSGTWLAYGIARGDPENERGQVAVVPTDLSTTPIVIASQDGGFYDVVNWIDEDTLLLFLTREGQGSVWRAKRDGSDLMQLATGSYVVGMIAND